MRPASAPRQKAQGRYVLGELLGRGGMAEVFSGYVIGSHGFQKPVAIKRLLPELANDHVFVERLIGEAKLLVGMQHGNIVSVMDLARDGDDVFLVMEFVDGPSLRQLLKARGKRRLPLGVASYIVQSAAQGLELAHGRSIIHADISPSNLLLTTSGEVRVADFGIARRDGGGAGVVEGKWAYMAPEQARGEALTPRSDVFALGVVLYELITGEHPLGRQISAEERDSGPIRIVPPRIVNPAVPAGLDAICMRALADDARDRYARMQQLIDAIMDERFTNQWREGANDLAQVIREITPGSGVPASTGPRTQVTDRPVTIVTKSLISHSARHTSRTPKPETITMPPPPSLGAEPIVGDLPTEDRITEETYESRRRTSARGSIPLIPPSGAQTMSFDAAALPPIMLPPILAASGPELASVHGGATVTGSALIDMRETRSNRWTFAVLGVASLLGVFAAVAMQLAPTPELAPTPQLAANVDAVQTVPLPSAPAPAPIGSLEPTVTLPAIVEAAPAPIVEAPAPQQQPTRPRKARAVAAAKRAPAAADAMLRVYTYGGVWARINVAGEVREIPDGKFKVPAGTYKVKLRNPDLGLTQQCTVTLAAGQVRTLRVEMEEGQCDLER